MSSALTQQGVLRVISRFWIRAGSYAAQLLLDVLAKDNIRPVCISYLYVLELRIRDLRAQER